jgi:hypothetical protein
VNAANHLAASLALVAGLILLAGLLRLVRLMKQVVRTLAAAHILIEAVADATEPVDEYVGGITTNVGGIESVASAMSRFVEAHPANQLEEPR